MDGRQETVPIAAPRATSGLAVTQDVASLVPLLHGAQPLGPVAAPVVRPRRVGPVGAASPVLGRSRPVPLAAITASAGVVVRLRVTRATTMQVVVLVTEASTRQTVGLAARRRSAVPAVPTVVVRGAATLPFATAAVAPCGLPHGRLLDAGGPATTTATSG